MPRSFLTEEKKVELRQKDKEARQKRRQEPYRQQEPPSPPVLHSTQHSNRRVIVNSPPREDLRHRLNRRRSYSPTDEPLDLSRSSTTSINSPGGNKNPLDLSLPSTSRRIISFVPPLRQQEVSVFDRLGSIAAPPISPLVSSRSTNVQSENLQDNDVLQIQLEESEAIH